jgi:hypothetical protein
MPTRSEEINAFVDESLGLLGLDKTDPQLRLAFLEGLQKSWDEDEDVCLEKTFYTTTLTMLISMQKLKLKFADMKVRI